MKKSLLLLVLLLSSVFVFAQGSEDIILKTNGDEMKGKVTELTDSAIKFIYTGEALMYTVKKHDILKITFASGRVEFFNKPKPVETNNAPAANTDQPLPGNKIAILPFSYLIDHRDAGLEMGYKVQAECYTLMKDHAGTMQVQAPGTTNALLLKAGVNADNFRSFTMMAMCKMLNVEYVIQGSVSQNKTAAYNYQHSTLQGKTNNSTDKDKKTGTFSANASSSSTSTQSFKTVVNMNVFRDNGDNLYSKDRESFWSTADAYKVTMEYLLKRTPLYVK